MDGREAPRRSEALAERLRNVAAALIAVVEPIEGDRWSHVPHPGVWSIGKDAEHVADAAIYHQWIVRSTIREGGASRRPAIERTRMTTDRSPPEVVELLHTRTEDGVRLLLDLTEAQLNLPTRPPRARAQVLAETIERVLIGHYDIHRVQIEAKLAESLAEFQREARRDH